MKATLEFDLPEEKHEHELAMKGPELANFQEHVFERLRHIIKYEDISEETANWLEKIQEELAEESVQLEHRI